MKFGKDIITKFLKENINWSMFTETTTNNVIEIFIDVIYKHNIDPYTIRITAPQVSSFANFWDKHSEKVNV